MGLDACIFPKPKTKTIEQCRNEWYDRFYWRKNYVVDDYITQNCKETEEDSDEYILTKAEVYTLLRHCVDTAQEEDNRYMDAIEGVRVLAQLLDEESEYERFIYSASR